MCANTPEPNLAPLLALLPVVCISSQQRPAQWKISKCFLQGGSFSHLNGCPAGMLLIWDLASGVTFFSEVPSFILILYGIFVSDFTNERKKLGFKDFL